jgi:hypothetical protein
MTKPKTSHKLINGIAAVLFALLFVTNMMTTPPAKANASVYIYQQTAAKTN